MFGGDAFGVELDAVDGEAGVAEAHDVAVIRGCIDDKASWNIINDQRVIARREEG